MATQEQIEQMSVEVNNANVVTVEGRGVIASNCNKLYNIIEKKIISTEQRWMVEGAYHDLFEGNFADPFHCEQKRHAFRVWSAIYKNEI